MASLAVIRMFQRNCSRSILCSSNFNLFYRRIPFQAISSAVIQKPNPSFFVKQQGAQKILATRKTSSDVAENGHDHVMHWTAERILSLVLLGTIPAACLISSPAIEYVLAASLTIHAHWGVEAIVCDYVNPSVFGKIIPKVAMTSVYLLSAVTLGGLFYFIYTDVGLVNAVKLLWKL